MRRTVPRNKTSIGAWAFPDTDFRALAVRKFLISVLTVTICFYFLHVYPVAEGKVVSDSEACY